MYINGLNGIHIHTIMVAYGCVRTVGGKENLLTKENAWEIYMLPQPQNLMHMFKILHCNGKVAMIILVLSLSVLMYVFKK